jgi:glucose-6-phosphate 1-dehydrogenase
LSNGGPTSGVLVFFGITGDLSRRYGLPALYNLCKNKLLPEDFEIIGVSRRDVTRESVIEKLRAVVTDRFGPADEQALKRLSSSLRIVKMSMAEPSHYNDLKATLDKIEDQRGICLNRLFYLSIPPGTYTAVVDMLGAAKLNTGCQHGVADSRIMLEKPFGYDRASAQDLIDCLKHSFTEEQIFRIDHYLAKETAQNILTFRFSNPIFQSVWDRSSVAGIQVTAAEAIGIEGRVDFYEPTGALRDFVQSHLLNLLALVTMEEPAVLDSKSIHAEKLKLLRSIKPIRPVDVARRAIRGQYRGYSEEVNNDKTFTETFANLELDIANERWRGVPISLVTGKRLARKTSQITLAFKDPHADRENTLIFRLQPNEGISVDLLAKRPGLASEMKRVEMTFDYVQAFGVEPAPDAYERVLHDGIRGDQTLFATSEEVLASWDIVDPVVSEWAKGPEGLVIYEPGSTPEEVLKAANAHTH